MRQHKLPHRTHRPRNRKKTIRAHCNWLNGRETSKDILHSIHILIISEKYRKFKLARKNAKIGWIKCSNFPNRYHELPSLWIPESGLEFCLRIGIRLAINNKLCRLDNWRKFLNVHVSLSLSLSIFYSIWIPFHQCSILEQIFYNEAVRLQSFTYYTRYRRELYGKYE